MILEARVDAALAHALEEFRIHGAIVFRLALQPLIAHHVRIYSVELRFATGDSLGQHLLSRDCLAIVGLDAAADAVLSLFKLAGQFIDLKLGFAIFGVVHSEGCSQRRQCFFGGLELLIHFANGLAPRSDLGRLHGPGLCGVVRRFFSLSLGLGVGIFGIELLQPRGNDAGYRSSGLITPISRFAEVCQPLIGVLHLGLQPLKLAFHKVRDNEAVELLRSIVHTRCTYRNWRCR